MNLVNGNYIFVIVILKSNPKFWIIKRYNSQRKRQVTAPGGLCVIRSLKFKLLTNTRKEGKKSEGIDY